MSWDETARMQLRQPQGQLTRHPGSIDRAALAQRRSGMGHNHHGRATIVIAHWLSRCQHCVGVRGQCLSRREFLRGTYRWPSQFLLISANHCGLHSRFTRSWPRKRTSVPDLGGPAWESFPYAFTLTVLALAWHGVGVANEVKSRTTCRTYPERPVRRHSPRTCASWGQLDQAGKSLGPSANNVCICCRNGWSVTRQSGLASSIPSVAPTLEFHPWIS